MEEQQYGGGLNLKTGGLGTHVGFKNTHKYARNVPK